MISSFSWNELERLGFPRILASPAITMGERLVGVSLEDRVPLEVASRAGERPMYLVHGDSDVRISNEHSKKFYNKAVEAEANVTLWLVEDSATLMLSGSIPKNMSLVWLPFSVIH